MATSGQADPRMCHPPSLSPSLAPSLPRSRVCVLTRVDDDRYLPVPGHLGEHGHVGTVQRIAALKHHYLLLTIKLGSQSYAQHQQCSAIQGTAHTLSSLSLYLSVVVM